MKSPTAELPRTIVWLLATCALATSAVATTEAPGPSSRRTGMVISEIMYHPLLRADGKNVEFVELYNSEPFPADLGGYRLSGAGDFTFPTNTIVPALGIVVVAAVPADLQAVYGLSSVLGPLGNGTNSLPNDSGTIRLRNPAGAVLLEVDYSDGPPWPVAADGAGHSLALARPSLGEGFPEAWAASALVGGSPGAFEPADNDSINGIVINEFLAHTDDPEVDYIELYNHSNVEVDLSGAVLTDDPSTNRFVIPGNTRIAPNGFIHFTQTNLAFSLSAAGETIYLENSARTRVVDAIRFNGQENGVATGRFPDGADQLYRLAGKTPGAPNSAIRVSQIVINELMYNPVSGDPDDQYVELFNQGAAPADLSGWQLNDGLNFTFPAQTVIPSDGYLVVARNATQLLTRYAGTNSGPTTTNTLGNFGGRLSGTGERVELTKPDTIVVTNTFGIVETNTIHITVDEVTYGTGGRWPKLSDGGGSSLELIDPRANRRLASNWADSDESSKAPWTSVEYTGILDNGVGAADSLQLLLQGSGECLVDDVEVIDSGGANQISNPTFESNSTGWVAEGTESQSGWETGEGYNSAHCYHVRAVERGDDTINRIRTGLNTPLVVGSTATIRAKVRWLRGHPELLLRLRGNYLEAVGRMNLPQNPGTPGAPNSRALANTGPAIHDVSHTPILPAANQPAVVTARVDDPDGISQLTLNYRLDPGASYSSILMTDNGTSGDSIAGDGIYSATIPGQAGGALVAFFIQAGDGFTLTATKTFPEDAPARECLVRFGEVQPTGSLGTYRVWMTQATFDTWRNRNKLDNTANDVTFVYNGERAIYNTQMLYAGSPYISPGYNTPTGNLCGYTGGFPEDDRFLGTTDLVLDWPGRDNTAVQEQASYWIADKVGLPNNHRRFIHLHVNGVTGTARGSIYEDVQQPGSEIIKEWSPDDTDGHFFKIERWFEFSDAGSRIADPMPTLQLFTTTDLTTGQPTKKLARYRWNWLPRVVKDSANDFTNLFALVDAVNAPAPEPYTSQTEGLVDIEEFMGIFALEHILNNFDSYGHNIGKNMYAYKPERGKWQTHMFDIDWVMLASISAGYDTNASLFACNDPIISRMYNHPPFRRAYFRTVKRAVDGPMFSSNINSWLDARYSGLVANGVTRSAGQNLASPATLKTWIQGRRNYLLQQLAAVSANFSITSNNGNDFTANTNVITLAGTAPIEVKGLRVNGADYQTTWTSETTWSIRVLLGSGLNAFSLQGYAPDGRTLSNLTASINVTFTGVSQSPVGQVVINEIMYNPQIAGAGYVELFNNSQTTAFDLSGFKLNGVDFTFAAGTIIDPSAFLVVAADREIFVNVYGAAVPLAGQYFGNLDKGGETLSLVRPGTTPDQDFIVDAVTYDDDLPWPAAADGTGPSLQLVDAAQDNSRVANWDVMTVNTNTGAPPQWQYVTVTGTASTSRLYVYMTSAGDVYIDDLKLVAGTVPEAGANTISNGDFESAFPGPWTVSANLSGSVASSGVKHTGASSLHLISSSAGSSLGTSVWQDCGPLVTNATYTLSYWYLPSTNGSGLTLRLSGNGINSSHSISPPQSLSSRHTPGGPNSVRAVLSQIPSLWLNEIQPNNITGITDNFGEREPWVELYNAGTNAVDLTGFHLTDDYTNLTRWAFPANTTMAPGQFLLVWLDGEPAESATGSLHTSFRAAPVTGSFALVFPVDAQPTVLDYLNYSLVPADRSFGLHPDGGAGRRSIFYFATPGGTNNNSTPPTLVFINEWMAANTHTLANPEGGSFDDWIELHNPNSVAVDLTGYALADNLTNAASRWTLPAGTVISPNGFLLVWADDQAVLTSTNSLDLHSNFKLSQQGEAIGLFAPNGSLVDSVTFTAQTNDVSGGRWPDGAASLYFMSTPTPRAANVISGNPPVPVQIVSAALNDAGEFVLTWSAEAGKTYRVEYKEDLNSSTWNNLSDVAATGPQASLADLFGTGANRYYRIQLLAP